MIRGLLRLGIVGAAGAAVTDRLLARRQAGQPTEPIRSMVVVDAPIETAWALLADIERQPEWMHEMKAVRLVTPPPVGVGTQGEATVRILGISTTDPVTITEFEPPRRFAVRHEGAFAGGGLITLEPGADGTTTIVRWEETIVAPVLPHLADVALRPILGAIFQADLHRFRRILEA